MCSGIGVFPRLQYKATSLFCFILDPQSRSKQMVFNIMLCIVASESIYFEIKYPYIYREIWQIM